MSTSAVTARRLAGLTALHYGTDFSWEAWIDMGTGAFGA
jgi:hypothetical protein